MKKFKTEKEIKEFFGSELFGFEIMCDGVIEYKTLRPIKLDSGFMDFKISFFPEDKPFFKNDCLNSLLGDMQIFEVICIDTSTNVKTELYFQQFIDYKNN